MNENQKYLEENGLPRHLEFRDGCIGEGIDKGAFRNLLAISSCYGECAEAVAAELVKRYNPKPLFQLHWQFLKKDGHTDHTEMRSQSDASTPEERKKWILDTKLKQPLPDGAH